MMASPRGWSSRLGLPTFVTDRVDKQVQFGLYYVVTDGMVWRRTIAGAEDRVGSARASFRGCGSVKVGKTVL